MQHVLSLDQVTKRYGDFLAVDQVSFNMPKGSIFGLLGPNGAGKTSIIRMITHITKPDSGTITLDGESIYSRHPEKIGYMPEERGLYKKMKVGEQLIYLAQLKGLSAKEARRRIEQWMEKFEIDDWWDKKVEELSKGMQQKIQFIATVVHEPTLLILDEPFSGLDPINTNLIKSEIDHLNKRGTSVIFSTHRMEQVEAICKHIVLINNGQNVLEGKMDAIKEQFKENVYQVAFRGNVPLNVENHYELIRQEGPDHFYRLKADQNPNSLLREFMQADNDIHLFKEIYPSLNEIFIKQVEESNLQPV